MATVEPFPFERRLSDFQAIVAGAQRTLAAQVQAALIRGDLQTARQRRLQLAAVQATLEQLGAAIDPLARQMVAEAYHEGAQRAADQISGLAIGAPEVPGAFAGVARDAVAALQDAIVGRLQDSRRTVGRTINDVYAKAGRRAALRAVLGAEGSPRAATRALVDELLKDREIRRAAQEGGFGFVDRAGKRWALDTYAEMAVRTTTREAVVQGSMARMASHGIDLARVSAHASACPICLPWEGRLISLSGDTSSYEGEAVADASFIPPFHPNCRHTLQPVAVRIAALARDMGVTA